MTASFPNPVLHASAPRVFLRHVFPTFLSLLAVSSVTVVDGLFVGNWLGGEALAAHNLLSPLLNIHFGLALMFALGGSVRAGKLLGAGADREAGLVFARTLLAVLLLAITIMATGLGFSESWFRLIGGRPELFSLMDDYFRVVMPFFLVKSSIIVLYFFIRLDGRPGLVAWSFVSAAVLKVVLNWLFIAHLGYGLSAAALATGLSHGVAFLLLMLYFLQPRRRLRLRMPGGQWWRAWRFAGNGIPEFVNEASVGLVAMLLNWLLMLRLGVEGVAAIAIYNHLLQVGLMFYFSIAHASQTLISQNHGAGDAARVREFLRLSLVSAFAAGLLFCTLILLFNDSAVALFLGEESIAVRVLAVQHFDKLWPVFLLASMNLAITAYFTAVQLPLQATFLAFSRSLALPALLLLSFYLAFPGDDFLYALPLVEALTFLMAVRMLRQFGPRRQQAGEIL